MDNESHLNYYFIPQNTYSHGSIKNIRHYIQDFLISVYNALPLLPEKVPDTIQKLEGTTLPTSKCQLSYFILTGISRIHFYLDILKNGGWAMLKK